MGLATATREVKAQTVAVPRSTRASPVGSLRLRLAGIGVAPDEYGQGSEFSSLTSRSRKQLKLESSTWERLLESDFGSQRISASCARFPTQRIPSPMHTG